MHKFKELGIWQKSRLFCSKIYNETASFPSDEKFGLINQLRRASVSIPSNISEGYGRKTDKSFSHFIDISRGSLNELETQLIIAKELEFIRDFDLYDEIMFLIEEESKMINGFSKTLK